MVDVRLFLSNSDLLAFNGRATDAPIDVVINDLRFIIHPVDCGRLSFKKKERAESINLIGKVFGNGYFSSLKLSRFKIRKIVKKKLSKLLRKF